MKSHKRWIVGSLIGISIAVSGTPGYADVPRPKDKEVTLPASQPTKGAGDATVKGSLDKEVIRKVLQEHIAEVRTCYDHELTKQPKLAGRVMIQFTIGTSGQVEKSALESSTLKSPPVEECIVGAAKKWVFPKPKGGVVVVTYPFILRSDEPSSDAPAKVAPKAG
jgi:TonB family protein